MTTDPTLTDSRPFSGKRVLDLSDEVLVQTGRFLAELGATVTRVESANGDAVRTSRPFLNDTANAEHALRHIQYNAGKRSVALDLESKHAWEVIDELARYSDLVIAPLEKSDRAQAFFDAARLKKEHSGLGVIDVVGRRGDDQHYAVDLLPMALGGQLYCNGYEGVAPDYPIGRLAFRQASFVGLGIAAGIFLQQLRSGAGARAVISLQECTLSTTIQAANENLWSWRHAICERAGMGGLTYPVLGADNTVALISAPNPTYPTKDGWAIFGMVPYTDGRWKAFAAWLEEATGDASMQSPEWLDATYRAEHNGQYDLAIRRLCAGMTKAEFSDEGQRRGLMAVPVNTVADVANDPHLHERGVFGSVSVAGTKEPAPMIRSPFRSSLFEPSMAPPPALGRDSAFALAEVGFSNPEIEELRGAAGLIGPASDAARIPVPARQSTATAKEVLPLAGVRVLDFTWQAAGPLSTEFLANLGADVVKLESVARIDTVRQFHHPPENASIDTGAFFADCNTGKRSITLNLNHKEGIALALEMAREADVVIDNFTPDRMDRWGLGYEDLRKVNPDIIVASLPVNGRSGPKSPWRGIGNSVVAMCSLCWHTGEDGKAPAGLGTLHTDFTLPPLAASLVMSALLHREKTGRGQQLEIAQYEAALHILDTALVDFIANGTDPGRVWNRSHAYAPHGIYRAAGNDRWVALAVRDAAEWQMLANLVEREDLAYRPDLETVEGRMAAADEIEAAIESWTSSREERYLAETFVNHGIPAAPLLHIGDLVESEPALKDFFFRYDHPNGVSFLVQNQPFDWNGERLTLTRAPMLGEHNEEVYKGRFGVSDERFVQLMVDEVIF